MFRALILCAVATPTFAEPLKCYPRSEVIARLDANVGERQTVRALNSNGDMIEFYVAPSGTWTLVVVPAEIGEMRACFVSSGTGFMMINREEM